MLWHRFPPQLEAVTSAADVVTVTAGGNDLGYLQGLLQAALSQTLTRRAVSRPLAALLRKPQLPDLAARVAAATDGLASIVDAVRIRAPQARVLLVDYLPVLDADVADPAAPLRPQDLARGLEVAAALSDAYVEAGRRSGAELVPASAYPRGHGLGSADPWIHDFHLRRLTASFHPNAAGMQAVADAVLAQLRSTQERS
jgi:lysophospholipase L1-like esterase